MLATAKVAGAADWHGFYVGANAGYGFGSGNNGLSISDGPTTNCHFCDNVIVSGPTIDHLVAEGAGSASLKPHGFSGGLQAGYNWQRANWIYGIEFEASLFRMRGTDNNNFVLPGNTALAVGGGVCGTTGPETCIGNFTTRLTTDWLVTIRPRIGYDFDGLLVYGTFGAAITRLNFEQTYADNITYPLLGGSTGAGGYIHTSASALRVGWIAGGGFAYALDSNWSLRAEYLYMRFDGVDTSGRLTDGFGGFADFTNRVDHVSFSVARLGADYRFSASAR